MRQDVLIIGAGPAGLATAISLARRGCKAVIVDRDEFSARRIGEHLSPEAITPLAQLGYSSSDLSQQHQESSGVLSKWGESSPLQQDYMFSPFGFGFNLSRPLFDKKLLRIAQRSGVQTYIGTRLRLVNGPPNWTFDVSSPSGCHTIKPNIAIDATGRSAWLVRSLGFHRERSDTTVAIISYIQQDCGAPETDFRLFVERGKNIWWYSTYLADGTMVIALMVEFAALRRSCMPVEQFMERHLQKTNIMRRRIKTLRGTRSIIVPAFGQISTKVAGQNWLAVGDSACCFDPLTGNGITKALTNGIRVSECILNALGTNEWYPDFYQNSVTETYRDYLSQREALYSDSILFP